VGFFCDYNDVRQIGGFLLELCNNVRKTSGFLLELCNDVRQIGFQKKTTCLPHIIAEFQKKTTFLPHIIAVPEENHLSAANHCMRQISGFRLELCNDVR
jgi:hypothetical protein